MKKIIKDRQDFTKQYCKGKKVLHLGCIGGSFGEHTRFRPWYHKNICSVAKTCVGLDIDKKHIKEAEKLSNSKIVYGDVTDFNLKERFEVIVAGEIIEHITNFDGFFNSITSHLEKDGILIITTPNVFKIANIARILLTGRTYGHDGHVVYFDIWTLKDMLARFNFKVIKHYYNTEMATQRIRNIFVRILGFIVPIYHLNLMVVCKKVKT